MQQEQVDQVIAALPWLAPSIIYNIANDALCGAYDGPDFNGSDQVFVACWKVELTNNGPFRFIQAIDSGFIDKAEKLIDNNYF